MLDAVRFHDMGRLLLVSAPSRRAVLQREGE
jgi:hypothetical protein